mmetsp:Transcript_804/g.1260  ORF Transcript_804/g.1260 Transcript_804/m.1260 type:complete len:98 (-) Transcript_804:88-381(-)
MLSLFSKFLIPNPFYSNLYTPFLISFAKECTIMSLYRNSSLFVCISQRIGHITGIKSITASPKISKFFCFIFDRRDNSTRRGHGNEITPTINEKDLS